MSAPVWVATGAASASGGAINPEVPSAAIPGDLLLLFVETADEAVSTPAGWTKPSWAEVSNAGNTRLTVFYRRMQSGDASASVADSGDHQFAVILAFRGCLPTGDPADTTNTGTGNGTSLTLPGVTTTQANCLIVNALARDNDNSGAHYSAWTNADLVSIDERQDAGTTSGNGGGTGIATGAKAAAGAVTGTTVTSANDANYAALTIALAPSTEPFVAARQTANNNGTGSVNATWPSGHLSGDIGILVVQTSNEAVTTPDGWTEVASSPQGTGTAATSDSVRLSVYWKRATSSSESAAAIADVGDHICANIVAVRRCPGSGNPIDASSGGVKTPASTSSSITGVTTTVDDCVVLYIAAHNIDSTGALYSAWANASVDNGGVGEIYDGGTTQNLGGGIAYASGFLTSAGATGTTTATLASSALEGNICIALKGGAAGAGSRSWGYILG